MTSFTNLLNSVLLAVAYASVASAAPSEFSARHATHSVATVGRRGLKVSAFFPTTEYHTFGAGEDHPLARRAEGDLKEAAVAYAGDKLGVDESSLRFNSGYTAASGEYAYLKPTHEGVDYANSAINVAFKDDKVVAFGSSFVQPKKIASSDPSVSVATAIATVEKEFGVKHNGHPPKIEYLVQEDKSAVLTHVIQVQDKEKWYEAFVDAHSGGIVSVVDFVSDATYRVVPIYNEYPTDGILDLVDPQDTFSSPQGWHSDGTTKFGDTQGNNVISYIGDLTNTTKPFNPGQFTSTWAPDQEPGVIANANFARINAFYTVNSVHDFAYRYGFTESAFNFQSNNFGKGGLGGDRVQANVQDVRGTNNANFATPPDGQSGQMNMYLWTLTSPRRDGALENDIVVHEMTHGISNRLTGGGTGRCLQTAESRGLGEGWSDALAEWSEQKSATISDFILGGYVYTKNIRTHPYSTSSTTNPLTYADIVPSSSPHAKGEIWANALHNVYAGLVADHGFSKEARTNPDTSEGNVVWAHLFFDALALQPCNPTFVQARAAWIQADVNRYGGANKCTLWKAFASKGLGVNAVSAVYANDFTVPDGC